MKDMTQGSPTRLLLIFSIPLLIGNLFQQLYNVSDTMIVGRTIGVEALAALGACGPLFFSSMGIFFVLIGVLGIVICRPMLELIHVPAGQMEDAYWYIAVIYWGIGAAVFYNMISSIIRALGDSVTPLIFLAVACLLNVGLDFCFILWLGWGVPGVAATTVIAQVAAGAACLIYARRKYRLLRLRRRDWVFEPSFVWAHLRVALPMALQFAILGLGGFVQQRVLNELGANSIAAFTAGCKVDQLAIQPIFSFGVALATFAAQNYGAGFKERIRQGVRSCIAICAVVCALGCAGVLLFSGELSYLFVGRRCRRCTGKSVFSCCSIRFLISFLR